MNIQSIESSKTREESLLIRLRTVNKNDMVFTYQWSLGDLQVTINLCLPYEAIHLHQLPLSCSFWSHNQMYPILTKCTTFKRTSRTGKVGTSALHLYGNLEKEWDPEHRFHHEDRADPQMCSSFPEHPQASLLKEDKLT